MMIIRPGKKLALLFAFVCTLSLAYGQKGSLFIIGGGERSASLMQELVNTAKLQPNDYVVVLPMSSGVPVESVEVITKELSGFMNNHIAAFNFTREEANTHQSWIDSVRNARLIYITGGDQNRFMKVVLGTALYDALHTSFDNGATIAGTSAGAAVMSQIMITGEEKDTTDKTDFRQIIRDNVITSEGMGFISSAIIDQHFVKRSRYNRLISVLTDHPEKTVIGIDEGTAIIVKGKQINVAGESQVVVISSPKKLKRQGKNKVGFSKARLDLLLAGDHFKLK